MNPKSIFILSVLLISASLSAATRPDSFGPLSSKLKKHNQGSRKPSNQNNKKLGGGNTGGNGGFFGITPVFGLPGFENGIVGGGYGAGFGGPKGGYSKGSIIKPTVVCKEKGPCYNKKLTCPAKCFSYYSRSGKGYGGGGGGGGCITDCKKKCRAYC
ncbi:cold shock domain-containing protein 4-like [Hibiscus syriacus]|uniref:cold shock domain-containing protein 4-like n=1 Tax=Hibiscus syriacus TaxID=106335 RepID=UPI0019223F33|nr:cold shock domain-containing protein 4-like [Hibiscus syriacus]